MKNLANRVNGNETDVFDKDVDQVALIEEYLERNERKKEDDKWLKANQPKVKSIMTELGKDKAVFGSAKVAISVPDNSKFDLDKVLDYLNTFYSTSDDVYISATKTVVDEEGLAKLIEEGLINLDDLKDHAWVESTGTPRLTVSKVKK